MEQAVAESEGWSWLKLFTPDEKPKHEVNKLTDISIHELLFSSYQMTQNRLTDLMLQDYPPDILVEIPIDTCSIFDFFIGPSLIELGREKCQAAIEQYDARLIKPHHRFWSWPLQIGK